MTTDDRDDELLRAAFAELRATDVRDAVPFDAILARSSRSRASFAAPMLRLVAAGVVLAAAIATYQIVALRRTRLTVPRDVAALAAWRPATDAFLTMSTDALLSAPGLNDSILDSVPGINTFSRGSLR